jgi:hypothetical protein
MGEQCPKCHFYDGHNVLTCPLVQSGKEKAMPGLSPEAVERLRQQGIEIGTPKEKP